MYLDKSIVIDFPVPLSVKKNMELLDADFERGDELAFVLDLEDFDAISKATYMNGSITTEQFHRLWMRYGLR